MIEDYEMSWIPLVVSCLYKLGWVKYSRISRSDSYVAHIATTRDPPQGRASMAGAEPFSSWKLRQMSWRGTQGHEPWAAMDHCTRCVSLLGQAGRAAWVAVDTGCSYV